MTELNQRTALELLAGYKAKQFSPSEVLEAVLHRIDACEPKINAMYIVARDSARVAAKAATERWLKGAPIGPLDGVPITLKDNVSTKGDPTPLGTAAADLTALAPEDAPPAARSREAGGVFVGKTTMPDFGMLASGVSSLHGITRNPWNLSRNTAGSSSGAGAAGAAGYGPLHIGTDIGGSVRLPAAYNGIFALKPSLGRIPVNPPFLGRATGPMTRTVADSALFMNTLALPDARDYMCLPYEKVDYLAKLETDVKGKRIGLLEQILPGQPIDPDVATAVKAAAKLFEDAGAIVTPVKPFLTRELMDQVDSFFRARAYALLYLPLPEERRTKMHKFIYDWSQGAAKASAADAFRSLDAIFNMRALCVSAIQGLDFMLSPTSPILPYAADEACPGNNLEKPFEHIMFTAPFNQSEQPAASINCGYGRDGMPIGLQIIGHRFDDLGVLQMARAYERMRPAQKVWPSIV